MSPTVHPLETTVERTILIVAERPVAAGSDTSPERRSRPRSARIRRR